LRKPVIEARGARVSSVEEALTEARDRLAREPAVLDWNTGAQQFYQRLGASHLTDWQYYRLPLD
jgi:hypothetical protein